MNRTILIYNTKMCQNNADEMATIVDPDQIAPSGAVWSGFTMVA